MKVFTMPHLFVYGCLMFPEILEALIGKKYTLKGAVLQGYQRVKVQTDDSIAYPVIVPETSGSVEGSLVRNVHPISMKEIDDFEEIEKLVYLKQEITVRLSHEENLVALTYVRGPGTKQDLTQLWNPDEFRKKDLQRCLNQIRGSMV